MSTMTATASERPATPAQLATIEELRDTLMAEVRQFTTLDRILQQVHAAFICSDRTVLQTRLSNVHLEKAVCDNTAAAVSALPHANSPPLLPATLREVHVR